MSRRGITLIEPGSILVILLAASVGFAIFSWSSNILDATGNRSAQQSQSSVQCTTLELGMNAEQVNSTHHSVFIQPNQDVGAIAVTFENGRNVTKIATDVNAGSIRHLSAKINDVSDVRADVKDCSRVFRE